MSEAPEVFFLFLGAGNGAPLVYAGRFASHAGARAAAEDRGAADFNIYAAHLAQYQFTFGEVEAPPRPRLESVT